MSDTDEILAVKAAELYYEAGKTQDEIGVALNISRWKVGRLLVQARERGFVRIEIVHPSARRFPLERELRGRFGLSDAVVVPVLDSDVQARVAEAAAEYLTTLRPVPRSLGVSWGRTLQAVAARLRPGWAAGVNPVQINGSVSHNDGAAQDDTAVTIARKAQGTATLLPSPAIFEHAETRRAVEADRSVQRVLALARSAAAYLFSAGVADQRSVHVSSGYLTDREVADLAARGAVGDVVGRFITATGEVADPALDERTLGITLDELRRSRRTIAVIAGQAKHAVCRAVVTSGLCSTLVTDEATATMLLESAPEGSGGLEKISKEGSS
ncbi:MAG TPA: sugar-binding transcriptional regulator [Microbacteriaceae bacterium]|nr:sugar-binding transcriptional regulator [Microbacteriaceae bacterium]